MKQIDGIGSSAVLDAQLARTSRNVSSSATKTQLKVTKTLGTVVDSAQLSTTSLLVKQNAGAEDVRYEKVGPLKQAIDAGTYSVPAAAVASKLIESLFG